MHKISDLPLKSAPLPLLMLAAVTAVAIMAASLLTIGMAEPSTIEPLTFEPQVLAQIAQDMAQARSQGAEEAARNGPRKNR